MMHWDEEDAVPTSKGESGTYFFTVVTYKRSKILCCPNNVSLLREAFAYVMERRAFTIDAFMYEMARMIWNRGRGRILRFDAAVGKE